MEAGASSSICSKPAADTTTLSSLTSEPGLVFRAQAALQPSAQASTHDKPHTKAARLWQRKQEMENIGKLFVGGGEKENANHYHYEAGFCQHHLPRYFLAPGNAHFLHQYPTVWRPAVLCFDVVKTG